MLSTVAVVTLSTHLTCVAIAYSSLILCAVSSGHVLATWKTVEAMGEATANRLDC
jgi:hypothetical protein